jgi:hypothetical protein
MRTWTAELDLGDHIEISSWSLVDLHLLICIFASCMIGYARAVDLDETFFLKATRRFDHVVEDDEGSQSGCCCCRQPQKFVDLIDRKVEGSRQDDKIQSPRSPRSAPIDEG